MTQSQILKILDQPATMDVSSSFIPIMFYLDDCCLQWTWKLLGHVFSCTTEWYVISVFFCLFLLFY